MLTDKDIQTAIDNYEPQTDCYLCKWLGDKAVCGRCRNRNLFAKAEDEPQTDIHDFTDCDFCKDRNCKDCEGGKDEPQTETSTNSEKLQFGVEERKDNE